MMRHVHRGIKGSGCKFWIFLQKHFYRFFWPLNLKASVAIGLGLHPRITTPPNLVVELPLRFFSYLFGEVARGAHFTVIINGSLVGGFVALWPHQSNKQANNSRR